MRSSGDLFGEIIRPSFGCSHINRIRRDWISTCGRCYDRGWDTEHTSVCFLANLYGMVIWCLACSLADSWIPAVVGRGLLTLVNSGSYSLSAERHPVSPDLCDMKTHHKTWMLWSYNRFQQIFHAVFYAVGVLLFFLLICGFQYKQEMRKSCCSLCLIKIWLNSNIIFYTSRMFRECWMLTSLLNQPDKLVVSPCNNQ